MKVNPSVGFEHYQSYLQNVKNGESSAVKPAEEGKASTVGSTNTDKVTFSDDAAAKAESTRVARSLASEVEGEANADRIAQLRDEVQNGSYSVPTERLVQAMLGYGV